MESAKMFTFSRSCSQGLHKFEFDMEVKVIDARHDKLMVAQIVMKFSNGKLKSMTI
jgi:hypothetical protein